MRPWPLGVVVIVLGLTTWLALAPGTTFPLPALAALADAGVPAVLQPYRADLPHLLGFAGLMVLFTALLGRAGVAAALVLGFATLLEAMQLFIPWREASWADLRVNLLAVALGLVLVGLGVTLGRWARLGMTALGQGARKGIAAVGKMARGQVVTLGHKVTAGARRAPGGGRPGGRRATPG